MSRRPFPTEQQTLRQLLRRTRPSAAEFDAFCVDHFPEIHARFSTGMERTIKENLLLEQADLHDLARRLGAGLEFDLERRDPVLSRVIDATRLRHRRFQDPSSADDPKVTILDAPEFLRGLLQVSYSVNRRPTHLGVAVINQAPSPAQIHELGRALDAHALLSGHALPSELVCVQRGFQPTAELQAVCDPLRITLFSLDEYEGLIDFSRLVEKQSQELSASADYPPALYVDQRLEYCEDGSFRFDRHATSAVDQVVSWLSDPSRPRFVLLIGDFGHGKTFLLREVCRRLGDPASRSTIPITPLFCELRELEKAHRLEELLVQFLARRREQLRSPDPDALLHMLSLGRVVLFFDGFDELALRTSYDRAAEHLNTLLQAVSAPGSLAKVVLTSRTQHFLSDVKLEQDLARASRTVLGDRLAHLPMGIGRLPPFDRGQIQAFLKNWLRSDEKAQDRLRLIEDVKDLLGLSTNPRLLSFIAALPEEDLRAAKDGSGEVTAASLYRALLQRWLKREAERTDLGTVKLEDGIAARYRALTQLALRLWLQTERTASVDDLEAEAQQHLQDLTSAEAAHELGARTLLSRDAKGRFAFFHESILEWLVARAAADALRQGSAEFLGRKEASALFCEFFHGHYGKDPAAAWAETVLLSRDDELGPGAQTQKHNAQQVLERLGRPLPECQQFVGHDLHARTFSHQRLIGANFTDANLRGAKLYKADLRRANFTRADLTGADLMGADLRGAIFNQTTLRRCRLIGARLDPSALAQLPPEALYGSAGPALSVPQPMVRQRPYRHVPKFLAYSPDGALLAVASAYSITLFTSERGEAVRVLAGHTDLITCVSFSEDGRRLASASWDKSVRIWEMDTGTCERVLQGHEGRVDCVSFSGDGRRLASGSGDQTVRIWAVATGTCERILKGHTARVNRVRFSSDGRRLASGSFDTYLRVWLVDTGTCERILKGHLGVVTSVCFSGDGQRLASGSQDGTVRIWQLDTGRCERALAGHQGRVMLAGFSGDGQRLTSWAEDGSVRVWAVDTGTHERTLASVTGRDTSLCFSGDGRRLAMEQWDGTVGIWELDSGQIESYLPEPAHEQRISSVSLSSDGQWLASGSKDHLARIWAVGTGACVHVLAGHTDGVDCVSFSQDGQRLASASEDQTVRLWGMKASSWERVLSRHQGPLTCVGFSPNGRRLASGSVNKTVCVWETVAGSSALILVGHENAATSLSFSPDGRRLASGSVDKTVRIWEVDSGTCERILTGHQDTVHSVCFLGDERRLASGSADQTIRIWGAATGACEQVLSGHRGKVHSVSFSDDGRRLASGSSDQTIRIWAIDTGACERVLTGHLGTVNSVAFSSRGGLLVSGSSDNTVRLWDAAAGQQRAMLVAGAKGWVTVLPDGRYKASGDVSDVFWYVIGLCRFEVGELDEFLPGLRLPIEQPLHDLPPWQPPAPVEPPALIPAASAEARVVPAARSAGHPLAKSALLAGLGVTGGAALYFLLPAAHWAALSWLLISSLLLGMRLRRRS